ncbi:MAG TPA: winged helix-turn-helix domain-containing protein [Terriglobales bacterium]|nr:winged helix-turn-helix domain-containing protein [Terriglobales bacterium]
MPSPTPIADQFRFGVFQLDLKARELHKAGVKVKLQDQPFRVLAMLVEHAGGVVTREELQQKIWPTDVYVTFDQGLNNAVKKVRDALGDSADNPRFVETVARQGYRFVAPVSTLHAGPPEGTPRVDLPVLRRTVLIVLASCLVAALGYWAYRRSSIGVRPSSERAVLAVLPFDNLSHDPDQEFFSDGLTEEMIAQLGKLNPKLLTVIARGSVSRYKSSSLTANQIGRELNADYLLQGSVRRESGRVRITVQLIQVRDQTDLWTESYDRDLKDILVLQDSVARTIADQIRITLTSEQQRRLANPRTVDPEAYDAYLRGRYYWNKRTADAMQKASAYFQQAVNRDPAYGAAYSGLADCNSALTWHGFTSPARSLPKAEAAAHKAIEIDPQSAEGHASLALALHHKWDWDGAEAEFKRALQLDSQYANAHHWYGDYLSVRGQHDEALLEARQALKLDPLNLMINSWVALRYYLAHNYGAAIEQGRNAVELDPNFAAAHLVLGEAYVQTGRYDEALVELQAAAKLSGDNPLYLAQVAVANAAAGKRQEALRIVAQLQKLSRERYLSPYAIAQVYAALNDKEHTFQWLQTAFDDRAVWMSYLGVDPLFDRFHSDQRYHNMLRHVGLLR